MKRILFVLAIFLCLGGPAAVPQSAAYAAADATCSSDPSAGPVGTTFGLTCWGYTPGRYVYAYLVEPTGAAVTLFDSSGAIRVKQDGSISYTQESKYGNSMALQTGTWTFVAEELGLARTVLRRGGTTFTVTGGTEGVSGASFSAGPTIVHKPEQAYDHFSFGSGYFSGPALSEPVTLSGNGFMPGETVTIWTEPPGGGCPSMTRHNSLNAGSIAPGIGGLFIRADFNSPLFDGIGSQFFADVKANQAGEISGQVYFYPYACEGSWRFVARGIVSGKGAETWVTVVGNAVTTDALLTADPASASAMYGTIRFSGSGFGANEHITCWLTTPQGRTIGYPEEYFYTYSLPTEYLRNEAIKANANGAIGFSLVTGSLYERYHETLIIGGVSQTFDGTFKSPIASEGALGEYAMSCRGDSSDSTAIARFTLTGGFVDP